jgi:hypothetical protein
MDQDRSGRGRRGTGKARSKDGDAIHLPRAGGALRTSWPMRDLVANPDRSTFIVLGNATDPFRTIRPAGGPGRFDHHQYRFKSNLAT